LGGRQSVAAFVAVSFLLRTQASQVILRESGEGGVGAACNILRHGIEIKRDKVEIKIQRSREIK
jgi:hypothetical protein